MVRFLTPCLLALLLPLVAGEEEREVDLAALDEEAREHFERGAFTESIASWKRARTLAHDRGKARTEVSILVNIAQACLALGNPGLADLHLGKAEALARSLPDEALLLRLAGVRAASGLPGRDRVGADGRRGGPPPVARQWAEARLADLQARLANPDFPGLTDAEWAELTTYLESLSGLRWASRDLHQGLLETRIATAETIFLEIEDRRNRLELERALPKIEERLRAATPKGTRLQVPSVAAHNDLLLRLANLSEGIGLEDLQKSSVVGATDLADELWDEINERLRNRGRDDPELRALAAIYTRLKEPLRRVDLTGRLREIEVQEAKSEAQAFINEEERRKYYAGQRSGTNWALMLANGTNLWQSEKERRMLIRLAHGYLPALVDLAAAHFALVERTDRTTSGVDHAALSLDALAQAALLSESLLDPSLAFDVMEVHGALLAFLDSPDPERKPEEQLLAAWAAARQQGDPAREATILNDLGLALVARDRKVLATHAFDQSIALAAQGGDDELLARATLNRAKASGTPADRSRASARIEALPDTHAKALMLLSIGSSHADADPPRDEPAYRAYKAALEIARANDDTWLRSYALGLLGRLYLDHRRDAEALELSRRALHLAQGATLRSDDLMFRWTWQIGRILRQQGHRQEALSTYERAEELMAAIRRDLVVGLGRRGPEAGFRKTLGPFYDELADLYFARARDTGAVDDLKRARGAAERFKSALLEDYFQDPGITSYRSALFSGARRLTPAEIRPEISAEDVARRAEGTALIYLLPLADRTEILASIDDRLVHHTAALSRQSLEQLADELRTQLDPIAGADDRGTAYRIPARALYHHLLAPLAPHLERSAIHTLVIVPDGKLRSVPMAVLMDGDTFLIDRFALAVVPDLSMMPIRRDGRQLAPELRKPLLVGLSEPVQGFSGLPGVEGEIDEVLSNFDKADSEVLRNRDYTSTSFGASFRDDRFDLVHIASHANFSTDLEDTFILTYGDRIGPRALEQSVRQLAFRERPVELLVLSACETAVGDDRASLGLAGIAVKSGAHSVLASLWAVDDRATQELIRHFYSEFLHPDRTPPLSKARSLQRAQRAVKARPGWSHPQYWAPFTVIGNWLAPEERVRLYGEIREQNRLEREAAFRAEQREEELRDREVLPSESR